MPIRRQAGATSSVPSAGRAGKSWVNSADPITPTPTRARTPVVVSSYATTASFVRQRGGGRADRRGDVAQDRGSHLLGRREADPRAQQRGQLGLDA